MNFGAEFPRKYIHCFKVFLLTSIILAITAVFNPLWAQSFCASGLSGTFPSWVTSQNNDNLPITDPNFDPNSYASGTGEFIDVGVNSATNPGFTWKVEGFAPSPPDFPPLNAVENNLDNVHVRQAIIDTGEGIDGTTQFEAIYGQADTADNLLLRVGDNLASTGSPIPNSVVATFNFNSPTIADDFGFLVMDLEHDQVRFRAKDENGNDVPIATIQSWFAEGFDADGNTASQIPNFATQDDLGNSEVALIGSSTGETTWQTTIEPPGNEFERGSSWFQPDITLSELSLEFQNQLSSLVFGAQPSIHVLFASCLQPIDFGDAPPSYNGSDAPSHIIKNNFLSPTDLRLGTNIADSELMENPTIAADGDGTDEDGVPSFPAFTTGTTSYTVPVSLTNTTGATATVCGWIDLDRNGTFDVDEQVCNAVASGATSSNLVFDTSAFVGNENDGDPTNDLVGNARYYARFRICSTVSECNVPTGAASDGEIEDYLLAPDTLPVTLSHVDSTLSGNNVEVDWSTSSELFNVGFQLWGLDGSNGEWTKLHNWLVKSGSGNAIQPQSYRKAVRIPNQISELSALGISSVDSDGSEHYHGPFGIGQSYGELSSLAPIPWDDVRAEVDARMVEKGYVKDRVNGYRKVSAAVLSSAVDSAEFRVLSDGMYRVTSQDLLNAGLDWRAVRKGDMAIVDHAGEAVVRYVLARGSGSGQNRTLGANGEIYFYGLAPDEGAGLYTDASVYRLIQDRYRALNTRTQKKRGMTDFATRYIERSVVEHDRLYVLNSTADDPWLASVVVSYPDRPRAYGVQIPVEADADFTQPAVLTLGLGRSSALSAVDLDGDSAPDVEHIVEGVVLSEAGEYGLLTLGRETATGDGAWAVDFEVPGDTPLTWVDNTIVAGGMFSAGTGYGFSEVHVDWASYAYHRPLVAKAGDAYLHFEGDDAANSASGYEVAVPDTGWPWVFASDGANLVRIAPESQHRNKATGERVVQFSALQGQGLSAQPVRYWVSGRPGYLKVDSLTQRRISTQERLLKQVGGSTYLIIAHPVFMGEALSNYAAFKRSQGYTVSIVDYLSIVERFGGGQAGPHGLTAYLRAAEAQGNVAHVLIVGGSTYDHTGIEQSGAVTFIPGHYGESGYSNYTVSDVPYITDSEGQLFAGIGRWPVRSMGEVGRIVDKSMRWSNRDAGSGQALLIAENTLSGEGIDFAGALDSVAGVLPTDWSTSKVYVDQVAAENGLTLPKDLPQALLLSKAQMIAGLNTAPDLVLYNGHASTRQLSNNGLFKSQDIAQLTQGGSELWLPLSCYVTFYESTHVNTLAHQLLFTGNAVSITGAMLLSNQQENVQTGKGILNRALVEGKPLGEAVNMHKVSLNNHSLTINWALLGDPTLKVVP